MLQLPVSFTDPFVIVYNFGVIIALFLWVYQDRTPLKRFITEGKLRNWYIFSFIWLIFSLIANFFFLQNDVDDAVMSGTSAFVNQGINPYAPCDPLVSCVVVHLLPTGIVKGLYHYFPSDLLVYALVYFIYRPFQEFFPFLLNSWFFIANVIFLVIGYFFSRKILNHIEDKRLIPIYIFVTSFFLFSNSSLAALYFIIGFYCLKKLSMKKSGITLYVLSAGVKYVAGLLLLVQFFEEAIKIKSINSLKFLIPYIIGGFTLLILIFPFGIKNVFSATILYQGDISYRGQVAGIYGPILIEFIILFDMLDYFTFIFLIMAIISLILAFKFGKSTYEKQMIVCFLFMLILPFYATELAVIPLLLWMFKLFDVEYNVSDPVTKEIAGK